MFYKKLKSCSVDVVTSVYCRQWLLLLNRHHPLSNATEYLCDRGTIYVADVYSTLPSLTLSYTSLLFVTDTTDSEG